MATDVRTALSPRVLQVLESIQDDTLRANVQQLTQLCSDALSAVNRIHLPQDNFLAEADTERDNRYPELAPYVLSAVQATNTLVEFVAKTFPASAASAASFALSGQASKSDDEFELEFDRIDQPQHNAAVAPSNFTPEEKLRDLLYAYCSMLRSSVLAFGERLKSAVHAADAWALLRELDDHKRRLIKALQAVMFGTINCFAETVRREEALPEYHSAVTDAVDLRRGIMDLAHHIGRFNTALAEADDEQALPLLVGIRERVVRFAQHREYRSMRADDKRAVIDFCQELHNLRQDKGMFPRSRVQRCVEGFAKFLEAMRVINMREVLVLHDQQVLTEALQSLDAHPEPEFDPESLREFVKTLLPLVGRSAELDAKIRAFSESKASTNVLIWRQILQQTMDLTRQT